MADPVQKPSPSASKRPASGKRFVASFVHYRTGRRIYAADYGHKGFPLGR